MPRIALPLGAHHGNLVAGRDERLAFKPHPPVERDRKILDDDEDPVRHTYKNP